jgi:hypothetical protein
MATKIINNVIPSHERQLICNWLDKKDQYTDIRPDVTSKNPKFENNDWPKFSIESALNRVLDKPYKIESVIFYKAKGAFRLHVDSANGEDDLYKVIIFPLKLSGPSSTVIFDNHWHGPSGKFSKQEIPQFEYTLELGSERIYIPDMRKYKTQDKKVKALLEDLIKKRKKIDGRHYNYNKIGNINNKPFPVDIHNKYMNHIPYENLHGLTVDKIVEWQEGSPFIFDRTQLHCGTNTHTQKIFCTVFTFKA